MIELTKVQKRICRYCKEHFVTRKRTQRFCSEACRYRYYRDTHIMISLQQWAEYQKLRKDAGLHEDSEGASE